MTIYVLDEVKLNLSVVGLTDPPLNATQYKPYSVAFIISSGVLSPAAMYVLVMRVVGRYLYDSRRHAPVGCAFMRRPSNVSTIYDFSTPFSISTLRVHGSPSSSKHALPQPCSTVPSSIAVTTSDATFCPSLPANGEELCEIAVPSSGCPHAS